MCRAAVVLTVGWTLDRIRKTDVTIGEFPCWEAVTGRIAVGDTEFPRWVPCIEEARVVAGELPRVARIARTAVVPLDGGRVGRTGKN